MSDAERYLRELRRALPFGCRRRFVAEMREHFASAADSGEPERLAIERLGPAEALAEQLLVDLRSGALGRVGRVTAGLTTTRLVATAGVTAIAIAAGIVFAERHSSPAPAGPQRTARPAVVRPAITIDPTTGEIRAVMYGVQSALARHQTSIRLELKPVTYYVKPAQN
jgi:hypothetical protein